MSEVKFHIVTDDEDDSRWTPLVDTPDGQSDLGSFATPGGAVDAVERWATGRGFKLCFFTVELRRPPSFTGWEQG